MKTEELTALGLTEEQAKSVFALNGRDVNAAKERAAADAKTEIESYKAQFESAETTISGLNEKLRTYDSVDLEKIQKDIQTYKERAEAAEKDRDLKITQRDQRDWLNQKMEEYGVASPYARKQLIAECMDAEAGLTWKEGKFYGFDDYMKDAKSKDASLYLTQAEKDAIEQQKQLEQSAPKMKITAPLTPKQEGGNEKYVPPIIF